MITADILTKYDIAVSAHSEISILGRWPMRKEKSNFFVKDDVSPFSMPE